MYRTSPPQALYVAIIALTIGLFPIGVMAMETDQKSSQREASAQELQPKHLLLPYPFYNDTIGTGIGVALIAENYLQAQTMTVGSALVSANGTGMFFLMDRNRRLPAMERLFIEPTFSIGKFQDMQIYTLQNPKYPNERPGSNDSNKNNYRETDGTDNWADISFKYLLPIGHGKENILPTYTLIDGIPSEGHPGGHDWSPFHSGRSFVEMQLFYRNQSVDDRALSDQETLGLEAALIWDNTDFYQNPSKGSFWRVFAARDWGTLSESAPWTIIGGELSKYFDLGASPSARQRTLALNFWTVDSPTWESSHTDGDETVYHRPPSYKGANLGGLWRLRGFPATRFHDRAAVHYSVEYRHTLEWNPLKKFTMGGNLDVDWLQLVGFGDLGRVADEWDVGTLHEDMQWTAGAGLRIMVNHLVVRCDVAASGEDVIAQLFISHPWPKR